MKGKTVLSISWLVVVFLAFSVYQVHGMKAVQQIVLTHEDFEPRDWDQEDFGFLVEKAGKGDSHAQYCLGLRYLRGSTPDKKVDLQKAEEWFLKARDQDVLPAFVQLVGVVDGEHDSKKKLRYAQTAVDRGFLDEYNTLGMVYDLQKNFKQARKYYELAIKSLEHYQDCPYLALVSNTSKSNLFVLLKEGLGGPLDLNRAMQLLKETAAKGDVLGMYNLALEYVYGNSITPRNLKEAATLFSAVVAISPKLLSDDEKIDRSRAFVALGLLYEKGFDTTKPNVQRAKKYYEDSKIDSGKLHVNRLIWAQKIPGDKNEAEIFFEEEASKQDADFLAVYMYSTILIFKGEAEEGIAYLERHIYGNPSVNPLIFLQLALAYRYGFGVEPDEEKVKRYTEEIFKDSGDLRGRSLALVRGYMRLIGFGVKKDIKRGLELIVESENKFDDVYFDTDQLFPVVGKIKAEIGQQLVESELKQKSKSSSETKGRKGKQKQKIAQAALEQEGEPKDVEQEVVSKVVEQTAVPEEVSEDPFKKTKDEWNSYFRATDGSFVSSIDTVKRIFVIEDPGRNEQLWVNGKELPSRAFAEIEALKFHKRVPERQGLGRTVLNRSTLYDHTFAEMLDFVIQYVGEIVPFAKDGSSTVHDQLVAEVVRKNLKTGVKTPTRAEYTFGQRDGETFVYHRLLRPLRVRLVPA